MGACCTKDPCGLDFQHVTMGELADEKALQKTLVGGAASTPGFKLQISPGGLRTWAELQQHVARQKAVKQLLNTPLPKNVKGPPDKDERIQLRCLDSAQIGLVSLPGVAAGMPGTPKVNQDYGFVMYPVVPCGTDSTFRVGTLIAGIFDGHGKGGESISRIAALKVGRSLELSMADTPSKPLGVRIAQLRFEKAFEFAEACVKELLPMDVYACAGTTGTAIVIHDDDDGVRRMAVGHVGDSRLIRGSVRPDGTEGWIVTARTRDHKPSDPEERARIEKAGGVILLHPRGLTGQVVARVHLSADSPAGLAVARAIGDGEMKTVGVSAVPSTMCIPLREEDKVLVIASDGLWEHLSDEEVLAFCYRYRADASLAAKALVLEAARAWYEKGTYRDDITVCVFFLPFEGSPAVVGLPPPPPISSVLPEHYVQFGIEWPQRNTTRSSSSDDAEFPTPRAPTPRA